MKTKNGKTITKVSDNTKTYQPNYTVPEDYHKHIESHNSVIKQLEWADFEQYRRRRHFPIFIVLMIMVAVFVFLVWHFASWAYM